MPKKAIPFYFYSNVMIPIHVHIGVSHWILGLISYIHVCVEVYNIDTCPSYASIIVIYMQTNFIRNLTNC